LLKDRDCADLGDEYVGNVLSASPLGEDGAWPHESVRDIIEDQASGHLETGLDCGKSNSCGVTTRGGLEGGAQEHNLAEDHRRWAETVEGRWPRTGRLLRRMGEQYRADSRHHDSQADGRGDEG
jgi:hypothetical protein